MRNYALPLLSLVLLASCSNEESTGLENQARTPQILSKAQVINAPLEKQIEYKRHHLKVLAQWAANERAAINIGASESFQKNQVAEQTFYLENLFNQVGLTKNSSRLTSKENLEQALDAFKDLDGETYLPVITIHDSGLIGQKSGASSEETLIIVEDNDLDGESYAAYLTGEGGDDLEEYMGNYDDPAVAGLPLLVIELNPCGINAIVDSQDINGTSPCGGDTYGGGLGGGFGSGNGTFIQRLVLNKMTVKDLKEIAPFRPEIGIKAYRIPRLFPNVSYYECGEFVSSSDNCYVSAGREITNLKRRYQNDERTYNYEIERNNSFTNDILVYVLFEKDTFPAEEKTIIQNMPNNTLNEIKIRSFNNIYDKQVLSQNPAYNLPLVYGHQTDNNVIKYNLSSR